MKFKFISLMTVLFAFLLNGCKEQETVYEDPYSGGMPPLGIIVNQQQVPIPASGVAGTEVSIAATGLVPHKDNLEFLFNGQKAEITQVTESGIKAKVPGRASSGVTAFVVNGQLVFGPKFTVNGYVSLDPTYKVVNGTNGTVTNAFEVTNGNWIFLGDFTNFDNKGAVKPINRIVRTLKDGTWDRTFTSGAGANGTLYDMATVGSQYYIVGSFNSYAQRDGISNITRISNAGVVDTTLVTTFTERIRYVTAFNGGTNGYLRSVYNFNNKVVATGDFQYYLSRRYDQPSRLLRDSTIVDSVEVRQLVRFNLDGSLDKTWRFDPEATGYKGQKGKSWPGGNGRLYSMMHTNGKIVAYGQFNRFDDVPVGYIVRLNADGTIDQTFNTGGTGADNFIEYASYNAETKKYILVGRFRTFNGKPSQNIVLLNEDGTVDENFVPARFNGGLPTFAKQLNDGLIFVSGDFKTYDDVNRQGFLMLDTDGKMADGYNTVGNLLGPSYRVNQIIETRSEDNKRALYILGNFFAFDDVNAFNMVRVKLEL
jgi:hypothetical protein